MKIGELRTTVKKHSKKELEYIIAELYKLVPKNKKEIYQIDDLIEKPVKTTKVVKQKKIRQIEDIAEDVDIFHDNAIEQNYLIPNTIISKKERPKWRFVVKRLYKEIIEAEKNGNSPLRCGQELQILYETLTYACGYQIFSTYDSFESVGIEQADFFEQTIRIYRHSMSIEDFITKGINLVIDNELNRYTVYSELMEIFISYCQTPDMKELAVKELKRLWEKKNKEVVRGSSWSTNLYDKERKLNNYTEFAFRYYAHLFDFENAIKIYKTKYIEKDKEVKLYILIRLLFKFKEKDLIHNELKVARDIKQRDSLQKMLSFIEKNDSLPKYIG
ncbi:MAG: hypothetical protein U9R42_14250 [Bacteroidota bacterium]|nr:hypothetical protein [Bacteroidota bacterium]